MKIKVFANFDEENVITEKEYQKRFNKAVDEMIKNAACFKRWLEDNYFVIDIWYATAEEREEILTEWEKYCRNYIENNDDDMVFWAEFELEI